MESLRAQHNQPIKNTAKRANGARQSKAPTRNILSNTDTNIAVIKTTRPVSICKVPENIRRDTPGHQRSVAKKRKIPPATDPEKITTLWQKVMEQNFTRPNQTSKAKAKSPSGQLKRNATATTSDTLYPTSSKAPSTTSSKSAGNSITIDKPIFRERILRPRRIYIDNTQLSRRAFKHFGTEPPERYQDIPGLESTTVWLEGDESFKSTIVQQYKEMKDMGLCEAEFTQYALEYLFESGYLNPNAPSSRAWNTKRMIQLVTKLERLWKSPPVLDECLPGDYSFDVRPDASYWIPIDIFNNRYINLVRELTFVKYKKILCPYLSIEFKKDGFQAEKAETQVVVASSIALYNRFTLKEKRLRKTNKNWTEKRLTKLRHYGITFRAEEYTVWCTSPNKPLDINDTNLETWTGCIMLSVYKNDCDSIEGVQNLMEWINEIHRWGLTVHGPSCQRDVQHCIEADGIDRTSLGASQVPQDSDSEPEPVSDACKS